MLFPLSFLESKLDEVTSEISTDPVDQSKNDGWSRVYNIYTLDEFGNTSPEMSYILHAGFTSLFIGGALGGFVHSRAAYLSFIERNQATAYVTTMEAKRKLQDFVTVNFAKGAMKWGWRAGFFTTTYVTLASSISAYRGKSGVLDFAAAGCITGGIYKINLGLRGISVGTLVGGALGMFAGCITVGLMKLSGLSMHDIAFNTNRWNELRSRAHKKAIDDYNKNPELIEYSKRNPGVPIDELPTDNVSEPGNHRDAQM